jgi:hypothetical protein
VEEAAKQDICWCLNNRQYYPPCNNNPYSSLIHVMNNTHYKWIFMILDDQTIRFVRNTMMKERLENYYYNDPVELPICLN